MKNNLTTEESQTISQKIIYNALTNQINKFYNSTTQNDNIKNLLNKYQKMVDE